MNNNAGPQNVLIQDQNEGDAVEASMIPTCRHMCQELT